jgi:hypothetical protein
MSYDLWTNLAVGVGSRTAKAEVDSRNFSRIVHQATRDFGQYLASAEDAHDLNDRILQVEAELRESGVQDPTSVLEAVAAAQGDDDSEDDSDSDVPDFVDTDDSDSKDRDDEADKDDSDDKDRDDSDDSKKESAKKTALGEIPGATAPAAGVNPVVPRNVQQAAPAVAPALDPANAPQPGAQQILGSRSSLPFKARR